MSAARYPEMNPRVRTLGKAPVVCLSENPFEGEFALPNPRPKKTRLELVPKWLPLRRDGVWNRNIRTAVVRKSGVYAVRETIDPRTTLYVGESHTGKKKEKGQRQNEKNRFWKTLLRHFQPGSGAFEKRSEWVHLGSRDLDVALWVTPPKKTKVVEGALVLELEPLRNSVAFVPADDEKDTVPF